MDETNRRRIIQEAYNKEHGITPQTIISEIKDSMPAPQGFGWQAADEYQGTGLLTAAESVAVYHSIDELHKEIAELETRMQEAAKMLAFEEAAAYRDRIKELKMMELAVADFWYKCSVVIVPRLVQGLLTLCFPLFG